MSVIERPKFMTRLTIRRSLHATRELQGKKATPSRTSLCSEGYYLTGIYISSKGASAKSKSRNMTGVDCRCSINIVNCDRTRVRATASSCDCPVLDDSEAMRVDASQLPDDSTTHLPSSAFFLIRQRTVVRIQFLQ